MWKKIGIICFIAIVPFIILWLLDSRDYGTLVMFSREKKPVEVKYVDDIFGTQVTKTEWKQGFWWGLLPPTDNISPRIFLGVVPMSTLFGCMGIASFLIDFRNKRRPGKEKKRTYPNIDFREKII
jgi:hypothetical protein